jgi:hypothetical protein
MEAMKTARSPSCEIRPQLGYCSPFAALPSILWYRRNLNAIPIHYTPCQSSCRHRQVRVFRPIARCRRPCPEAGLEAARTVHPDHHTSAEEVAFRRRSVVRSSPGCCRYCSSPCSEAGECTVELLRRCCYCSRVLRCCRSRQDEQQPSRCRKRVGGRPCDGDVRLCSCSSC